MMSFVARCLSNELAASKRSLLLLGPRQTGKSTLLNEIFPSALQINLADEATYLDFAADPRRLDQVLAAEGGKQTIFIDEIQRLPSLLNTIQKIIDDRRGLRFVLTGSSARKLRRGQANLLPGRIHTFMLGPLVAAELGYAADEQALMAFGSLPGIYTESGSKDKVKTLSSYAATYLKEEIQAEALTRNIEGFARFLKFAAVTSSQFLDIQKLASQAQINHQTARRYFDILEDTLIVHRVDAFAKSTRTRLVQHPRFFFFDTGVLNGLLGNFTVSDDRKGLLFETLVVTQVIHSVAAKDLMGIRLSSYRTEHGAEVDLIIERQSDTVALEIKATRNIGASDLSGLASFAKFYGKPHRAFVAYQGDEKLRINNVDVWPWQQALQEIGL
jgi:predicted AAA+ superfamily ATPase